MTFIVEFMKSCGKWNIQSRLNFLICLIGSIEAYNFGFSNKEVPIYIAKVKKYFVKNSALIKVNLTKLNFLFLIFQYL